MPRMEKGVRGAGSQSPSMPGLRIITSNKQVPGSKQTEGGTSSRRVYLSW